jgi:hypothetical protein
MSGIPVDASKRLITILIYRWFCENFLYFRAFFIKSVGGFLVHLQDQHVLLSPFPPLYCIHHVHTFRRFFYCTYWLAHVLTIPCFCCKNPRIFIELELKYCWFTLFSNGIEEQSKRNLTQGIPCTGTGCLHRKPHDPNMPQGKLFSRPKLFFAPSRAGIL